MKKEDIEKLEDIIFKAVQSGKQETSDLVDHVLVKIGPAIRDGIEKHVNGKIQTMDQKLTDYILNDNAWKAEIYPAIKANTEFRLRTDGGIATIKWIIGLLGVGTIISIIMSLFK